MTFLILRLLLAYFLPWLVGYFALRILDYQGKFSRGFAFFAALPIGTGIFTMEIFLLGLTGLHLSLGLFLKVLAINLLILGATAWYLRRFSWPFDFSGRTLLRTLDKILLACFILILLFKVSAAAWQILHVPVYEFDAWNNWDLRAKVIFTEQKIPLDKTQPFYLGGGINSYPLHDPLWKVWVARATGSWHEGIVNLYSLVFYICLIGLFFNSLPRDWKVSVRLVLTYALASLPFLYFHAFVAYADLEFATYLFLSITALFWFLRNAYLANLILSALTLSLAIWTKNEGFAVVAPVMFLATVFLLLTGRVTGKQVFGYWLVTMFAVLPWLLFRSVNKLEVLSGNSSSFSLAFNSHFVADWFSSVFLRSHFNFLWLMVLVLLADYLFKVERKDYGMNFFTAALVLLFLLYNGIVLFTDKAYDLSALNRVNLHIAPLAVFWLALVVDKNRIFDYR